MSEQVADKMNDPVADANRGESNGILGANPAWTIGVFVVIAAAVIWKMLF